MFSRGRLLSSAGARRRKKRRRIQIALSLLFVVVVLSTGIFLLRHENLRISKIEVTGTRTIPQISVEEIITNSISGNYLFFIPKNSTLLFPKKHILTELAAHHEVESFEIKREGLTGVSVLVREHESKALYCEKSSFEGSESMESLCYLVSPTGYLFQQGTSSDELLLISRQVSDENTRVSPVAVGIHVLPKDEFISLISFTESLKSKFFEIEEIVLRENGIREAYLQNGGYLIFNNTENLELALQNLELLLTSKEFKERSEEGVYSFEYIDLQNSNKIFYK